MTATLVDHDADAAWHSPRRSVSTTRSRCAAAAAAGSAAGRSTPGTRVIRAPAGIVAYEPEEMIVRVRAGTTVAELHADLAARGQRTPLVERGGTVGGALAVGENDMHVLGRGTLRSSVLQVRYVSAEGRIVNGGGPTVKNVTGFDLPRLMVGSLGTLGLLAEVILRTNPIPPASVWLAAVDADPFVARDALLRPSAVLWDGTTTWVHLEGHAADIAAERSVLGTARRIRRGGRTAAAADAAVVVVAGRAAHRRSSAASGAFVAVIGVGLLFGEQPQPARRTRRAGAPDPAQDEGELRSDRPSQPRPRPWCTLMER